jgi:peptide/nickel transport system substrate-binding protein
MKMSESRKQHAHIDVLKNELKDGAITRRDFLRTATLLGVSATTAYAMAGLSPHAMAHANTAVTGGKLRVASRLGDISDPHTYSWGQQIFVRQCLEQLTLTGTDNITRPQLLEKWEASDDLKTWTLYLRKDVTWARDGRPFTADDVVWNLQRALDPATGSSTVGLFAGFLMETYETEEVDDTGAKKKSQRLWSDDAIAKLDDYTVVLNGKAPNLAIPESLFHQQLFMMDPADGGTFGVGSNFTGPYEIAEYEQGQRCLMQARSDYWGGGPYLETLEWIDLGDDPNAHLAALASNQIDGWPSVDNAALEATRKLPGMKIYEAETANTGAVRMRVDSPPFDNPKVRQAMRCAVDTTAVLQFGLSGLGYEGEHHFVSKVHPEYAQIPPVTRDVEKAKRLLAEAGHTDGIDAKLYLKSSPAWESQVVQTMIEQWKEAGIRIQMNPVPSSQYWEVWKKVPLGFTDWNHRPLGIMLYGLCFRTNGSWNESGYSNPEFDKALLEAEGKLDVNERRETMAILEQIMLDDGPIVQPVYRSIFGVYTDRMKNFTMHPTNYNYYKDVWLAAV